MADESDDKANGDVRSDHKSEILPEPEPVKVPDVELIVDGFGFMPKAATHRNSFKAKRLSKGLKEILGPEYQHGSPCSSSSNIDVVRRYTWKTKNRMSVQVITYGATITSIQVPDKKGVSDDVVAGFDTLEEYLQPRNPYFGATIGRYANVIRDATMTVKPSGRMYMLSSNQGRNHYNGGYVGFDKVNWRSHVVGNKVYMSHVSERFHEGYPGTVMVQISFEVTCENTINIDMKCTTTEPTIINLSNSLYFNLAGHLTTFDSMRKLSPWSEIGKAGCGDNILETLMSMFQHSGSDSMHDHIVTVNADKYTPVDDEGLVTGEKKVVGGTSFDFRVPRSLKAMLPKIPMGGYDVNFCITQGTAQDLTFHARALHPGSGRVLEVYSNQPGLQFYTGNLLPDPDKIVEPLPEVEKENVEEEADSKRSESESETDSESSEDGEEASEDGSEGEERYGYVPLTGKGGTLYKKHGLFCLLPQNYPDAINHKNFPSSILNPGEVYIHKIQYKFGLLLGKYV